MRINLMLDLIRVTAAGMFVCAGMAAAVLLIAFLGPVEPAAWAAAMILCPTMFALLIVAFVLFNDSGKRGIGWQTPEELEEKGLLVHETFKATRAFEVEEFEDEGAHYMLELDDGSVLFLSGQYLYEYEPYVPLQGSTDDPEPRRFPCTHFTIRRHRDKGYVVDILCRGEVLEPECVAPYFSWREYDTGSVPEDGRLYRDRSYDEIKSARLAQTAP